MPTKDDGKTYSCTHEEGKQNPSGICGKCMGKTEKDMTIFTELKDFGNICNVTKLIDSEIARFQQQALGNNIKDGGRVMSEYIFKKRLSDFLEHSLSYVWDKAVEATEARILKVVSSNVKHIQDMGSFVETGKILSALKNK